MLFRAIGLTAALLALPISAGAATLTYQGQNFDSFEYEAGDPSADGYVFRGQYDGTMSVSLLIELDGELSPSTTYDFDETTSNVSMSMNDGINTITSMLAVGLTTDTSGNITSWSFTGFAGPPGAQDIIKSSSVTGDSGHYGHDYMANNGVAPFFFGVDREMASASTTGIGSWTVAPSIASLSSVSVLPTVPLPAAGLMLGLALAGLGLMRKRR